MTAKETKPQLHQSNLQLLYRCGYKFSRVVLGGDREPSTTPLIVGTATHSTVAIDLTNKIEKGFLLPREAVKDHSRDEFIKSWEESPIVFNDEEKAHGLDRTKGKLQDQTIQLVAEHHYAVAPFIKPKAVERKWVLEAPKYPYDMAGMIDVDEDIGIRDTKTRKTNLGQAEVDKSEQYTFYALAKYLLDGIMPEYVVQDNLIKPTKKQPARAISYYSTRTRDDFNVLYRRFDQANKIIKAGIFTPANPCDWWCSKDFCGFAGDGSCPYFNSKSRKPINNQIEKEKDHGKQNSIIDSLKGTLSHENA